MKFIDQANIEIIAGKGGDGIISFRHEHRVEKGGPYGGDGGNGGSVYFQGDSGMNTLLPIHILKHIRGNDGQNGMTKNMHGANGKDIIVKVPYGTLVYENENLICDVIDDNKYLICKGGIGGRGNTRFKSSSNPAPKICENGLPGEKKNVRLELKVMADIGLVGLPSAGKSTILKLLSNAKPKIADYPFTTLVPQLGLVKYKTNSFVISDLPGIIENAWKGKGLGIRFLKHIERCKVIAFVIDFGDENKNPINDFNVLKNELKNFNLNLLKKTFLVIANKKDLPKFNINFNKFIDKFKDVKVIGISALNFEDLNILKKTFYEAFLESKKNDFSENETKNKTEIFVKLEDDFVVNKLFEGMYEISGKEIEKVYLRNPLNTYENILRFNKKIKDMGVWKELIKKGIKQGDTVRILGYQFTWEEE